MRDNDSMRIHVVADESDRDGGYVSERLIQRGGELLDLDRDDLPAFEEIGEADLILLLGSDKSAHEAKWSKQVKAESALVLSALEAGTPVMGICYGAQLMARAFGGTSWRSDGPEIGWGRVDTVDPILCPEGPWGQMHRDVFAPAPTSRVLGTTWRGPQCFIDDTFGARAIAWQFHPEVTPTTYERWVRESYFGTTGEDLDDVIRQAHALAPRSRNLAHVLTDAALAHLGLA